MNEYLFREDWRVQANANQGYSLGGLALNVAMMRDYEQARARPFYPAPTLTW